LLPPRVDEWIPAGHVARVVNEAVDLMDLSDLEATFHTTGAGAPAYHPKMLLKLLSYGYLTQRFSSRRISQACREDLAMMWLAQLEQPKHSAVADFRKRHVDALPGWLAQIVLLCADLGMVGFRLGAIDGSKLQADASKHKALSYQRMQEVLPALEAEIATLVAAHGVADQQETAPPAVSADRLGRLRERLAHIQQAQADLEARWAAEHPEAPTPPAKAQWNFTDPDSHIMVTKTRGVQQAYNGQIAVDAQEGVIVGASLSAHPNDLQELIPTLEAVANATGGRQFAQLTADAGYFSADNVAAVDAQHIDAYIAAGPDEWRTSGGQTRFGKGQFTYDADTNTYRCPAMQVLPWYRTRKESVGGGEERIVDVYRADRATCRACSLRDQCLPPKQARKTVTRGPDDGLRDAMKAKVRSESGDALYRTRKGQVEPAFGIIKETLGFRQFSLRGQTNVTGEWAFVCMAYNLRKIGHKIRRIADETGEVFTIAGLRAARAAQ
jgi:transposase